MHFYLNKRFFRAVLICLGLYIFPHCVYGQIPDTEKQYTVENIISVLRETGVTYEVRPLLHEYGGFGSSVHVNFPVPEYLITSLDDANLFGTFVLAVPIDSAFAVDAALAFVKAVKTQQIWRAQIHLMVAFLADEKDILDFSGKSHKGLRDLIRLPDMPGNWTVCYLRSDTAPQALRIHHGNGKYITPLELIKPLPVLFKSYGIPFSFEARYNEIYKLDLIKGRDEIGLLSAGEINSICLYPGNSDISSEKIDPKNLAAMLLKYAWNLPLPLHSPDQHYTIISLPGKNYFFISEFTSIVFLVMSIACLILSLLAVSAFHRVKYISRMRLFLRKGWIFFIILPLMILIVWGTGFLYSFINITLTKTSVLYSDYLDTILIILLAVWLFNNFAFLFDQLSIPRIVQLNGVSAVIIISMGFLVSAALDLTYTGIFLWAFVFTFFGGIIRKPTLIFISAFLIPLRAISAFININEFDSLPVNSFFTAAHNGVLTRGNLRDWFIAFQISVLCLPIMLLLKRSTIFKNMVQEKMKITLALRFGTLGCIVIAIVLKALLFTRQPEQINRTITGSNILGVNVSHTLFLDSRIVNIKLESPARPVMFSLYLRSSDNSLPLIYSSTVPVSRASDDSVPDMIKADSRITVSSMYGGIHFGN